MNDNYSDIIDMEHHVSGKHPRMDRGTRAAQFAPFAALSGYDKAVEKKGMETSYEPFEYRSADEWN